MEVLSADFFNKDTKTVAQNLLGKFLVSKKTAGIITETEVYDGFYDKASHAFRGRTNRTEIMFGESGVFYVYLCYGMYYMLNVVTREKNYPAVVLIRGVRLIDGTLLNGPGKITRFFGIDKRMNGKKSGVEAGLWFQNRGMKISNSEVQKTPRVGVGYAGPVWANKKLRFILES